MNGVFAIAWREVRQRFFLLVAAAASALVSLGVPLIRGVHGADAVEVRAWISAAFAALLGLGAAAALGALLIPAAIATRRIAFDLGRPVSAFAIFVGRNAAGVVLPAVAAAIALSPIWMGGTGTELGNRLPRGWPLIGFLLLALVYGVVQIGSIVVLSRSLWTIADCLAALGLSAIAVLALRRLAAVGAFGPLRFSIVGLGCLIIGASFAASLAALCRGRASIRDAHRALSATLWSVSGSGIAGLFAYSLWVCSPGPRDLSDVFAAAPQPEGSWIYVTGAARGGAFEFLYDTSTARSCRLRVSQFRFSEDDRHAVWLDRAESDGTVGLHWTSLPEPKPVDSRLRFGGGAQLLAVSRDGQRVAMLDGDVFSIYGLAEDRLLASIRTGRIVYAFFEDAETLRLISPAGDRRAEILRFDTRTKGLEKLGAIDAAIDDRLRVDTRSDRILMQTGDGGELALFDGSSGRLVRTLVRGDGWTAGRFLSDGRIAVGYKQNGSRWLEIFSSNGESLNKIQFPSYPALGGEILPNRLALGLGDATGWRAVTVDTASGAMAKLADRASPVLASSYGDWLGFTRGRFATGSVATRLFLLEQPNAGHALVRIDPSSGKQEVLLGNSAR